MLLTGCSAQVSGMQSPMFHDYGPVEWIQLDRRIEQQFIVGTGYSAAIDNDPEMTPEEYAARLEALPEDATSGTLEELRIGMRLADLPDGAWSTGATISISQTWVWDEPANPREGHLYLIEVDDLTRSGDTVIIKDLPEFSAGDVVSIWLSPGNGPQAESLQVAVTPHRAPYAGWRAMSGDELLVGALVFETRYLRDVAVGEIVRSGLDRVASGGSFLLLWGIVSGGMLAGLVVLNRKLVATDGR